MLAKNQLAAPAEQVAKKKRPAIKIFYLKKQLSSTFVYGSADRKLFSHTANRFAHFYTAKTAELVCFTFKHSDVTRAAVPRCCAIV